MTKGQFPEVPEFEVAIISARQGNIKPLLELLKNNVDMSAGDKVSLANLIEELRNPPVAKRGRPEAKLHSRTWYLNQTADNIRRISREHRIPLDQAMEWERFRLSLVFYDPADDEESIRAAERRASHPMISEGYRFDTEQILRELRRSQKSRKIRRSKK
jgi:hypothetical protein